jgi:hypothetical protein
MRDDGGNEEARAASLRGATHYLFFSPEIQRNKEIRFAREIL